MTFTSDDQRKAVMSQLNPGRGPNSNQVTIGNSSVVKQHKNLMLNSNKFGNFKNLKTGGLSPRIVADLVEIDNLHKRGGPLDRHSNGDPLAAFHSLQVNPNGLKIPPEELAKENGDLKKYVEVAYYGKHFDDIGMFENRITLAERKEQQRRWKVILENNHDEPRIKRLEEIEREVQHANKKLEEIYQNTESFWRGTSFEELKSMFGNSKGLESQGYKYYPVSLDPNVSGHIYNNGIVLEFDGDGIRKNNPTLVEYTSFPVPLGLSKSVATASNQQKKMNYRYIGEMEVRVPAMTRLITDGNMFYPDNVQLKNIYIDKETFDQEKFSLERIKDKYGANVIIVNGLHDSDLRKGKWKQVDFDWNHLWD